MNSRSQTQWSPTNSANALRLSAADAEKTSSKVAALFENDIFDFDGLAHVSAKAALQLSNDDELAAHLFAQLFAANNDIHVKQELVSREHSRGRKRCRQSASRCRRESGSALPSLRGKSAKTVPA